MCLRRPAGRIPQLHPHAPRSVLCRLVQRHREEVQKVQSAAQEQIAALTRRMEEEKAAAVRRAKEEALVSGSTVVEREVDTWRARETMLRNEFDREVATLRQRYAAEVEDERQRGLAMSRAEAKRHVDEVARLQEEFTAKLEEALARGTADKAAAAQKLADAVAAEAKVRAALCCKRAFATTAVRWRSTHVALFRSHRLQRCADEREAAERRMVAKFRSDLEQREADIRAEAHRARDDHVRTVIAKMEADFSEERRRWRHDADAMARQLEEVSALCLLCRPCHRPVVAAVITPPRCRSTRACSATSARWPRQ